MAKERIRVLLAVVVLAGAVMGAQTWRLEEGQDWKKVSDQPKDQYLVAVSALKLLADQGKSDAVIVAAERLKRDFPEIATPDLDAFIEAGKYYAAGNFTKAVRAYDAFLAEYPQSPLYYAALDREFAIAKAYLSGHKKTIFKFIKIRGYAEGAKVMDRVIDQAGDSPLGLKAARTIAQSYESRGKYEDAYQRWSQIFSRWPTGESGKESLLAMARCKHAAYRGPEYDMSPLVSAKSYYENYKRRYPEDAEKYEIDKRLEQIRQQLAYKQYNVASYYQRTDSKQCANLYSEMIVEQWPDTTGARRAMDILDKNESIESEKVEK